MLLPEHDWEDADLPLEPSQPGFSIARVNQLRDLAIYCEADRMYSLYSVADEQGIGIAEIEE